MNSTSEPKVHWPGASRVQWLEPNTGTDRERHRITEIHMGGGGRGERGIRRLHHHFDHRVWSSAVAALAPPLSLLQSDRHALALLCDGWMMVGLARHRWWVGQPWGHLLSSPFGLSRVNEDLAHNSRTSFPPLPVQSINVWKLWARWACGDWMCHSPSNAFSPGLSSIKPSETNP